MTVGSPIGRVISRTSGRPWVRPPSFPPVHLYCRASARRPLQLEPDQRFKTIRRATRTNPPPRRGHRRATQPRRPRPRPTPSQAKRLHDFILPAFPLAGVGADVHHHHHHHNNNSTNSSSFVNHEAGVVPAYRYASRTTMSHNHRIQ